MLKSLFEGDSVIVILVLARNTNRGFTVHATECKITVSCPLLWHVSMGHYSNLSPPPKKNIPTKKTNVQFIHLYFQPQKMKPRDIQTCQTICPHFLCRTSSRGFISWWMVLHGAVPPTAVFGNCGNFNKTRVVVTMLLMGIPPLPEGCQ